MNGLVVTLGRVPSIVVTLGTLAIFRGLNSLWAGGKQISADQVPQRWLDLTGLKLAGVPAVILIALVVLAVVGFGLSRFARGRELFAIGSNPDGAALIGIRATARILFAFLAAGLLAGFDGALWAVALRHDRRAGGPGVRADGDRHRRGGRCRRTRRLGQRARHRAGRRAAAGDPERADSGAGRSALAAGRLWPGDPGRRRHRRPGGEAVR